MPLSLSIGDVIAVSSLIKDAIKALDNSRGSAAEYQEVIRELWSFDRALLGVMDFVSRCPNTTFELKALCCTVEQNVRQCQQCVSKFLDKIKCYKKSLSDGACSGRFHMQGATDKLKWVLIEKDELAKFRAEISGHTSAINMLLITVAVHIAKISGDNFESLDSKVSEAGRKADEQLTLLGRVFCMVLKNGSHQESQSRVLSSLLGSFQYFYTLCGDLKSMMSRIWRQNTRMYEILMDLQTRVPREFGPCWIQDPVIFTDAHGRVAPLPLELVNSWLVLEKILAVRFESLPGQSKVERKEYVFQDQNLSSDINVSLPFDYAFRPGRKIYMSMVFRQDLNGSFCPGCKLESNSDLQVQIQCSGCGLWFQRLEEIHDESSVATQQVFSHSYTGTKKQFYNDDHLQSREREASLICIGRVEMNRSVFEEDINSFQRVRLLIPTTCSDFKNEPMDSYNIETDWQDFVIVETVLFTEADDKAMFLPAKSLSEFQSSSTNPNILETPLDIFKENSPIQDQWIQNVSGRAGQLKCEEPSRDDQSEPIDCNAQMREESVFDICLARIVDEIDEIDEIDKRFFSDYATEEFRFDKRR